MEKLISESALYEAIYKLPIRRERADGENYNYFVPIASIFEMLEKLPPAQSETAKRIIGKSKDGMTLWYQCDMCNEPVDAQDNFCRECGRRLIDE